MEFILCLIVICVAIYSAKIWEMQIENQITVMGLIVGQIFTFVIKFVLLKIQIAKLYFVAPLMMIVVLIQFLFDCKHISLVYKKFKNHNYNETGFLDFVFFILRLFNIIVLALYAYIAIGNLYCNYGALNYETQTNSYLTIGINYLIVGLTYSIRSLETLDINVYTLFAFCYQFCSVASIIAGVLPEIIKANNAKD